MQRIYKESRLNKKASTGYKICTQDPKSSWSSFFTCVLFLFYHTSFSIFWNVILLDQFQLHLDHMFPSRQHNVAYRPGAKRWLCKQQPLLGNARYIHARKNRITVFHVARSAAVSGKQLSKQVPATTDANATIEEPFFLYGPCRDVISK
jgi:hypothetical protein